MKNPRIPQTTNQTKRIEVDDMAATPRKYEWEGYDQLATDVTDTGAVFHFFDTKVQVLYPNGGLQYKAGSAVDGHWSDLVLSDETELVDVDYKVVKTDHPATGSLYIVALDRDNADHLTLFRYDYSRDVSELVQNLTFTLQSDNAITEIRADIKNVKDEMFIEETSLFAPSARLDLGMAYGKAAPTPLGIGYMDEADWRHGAKTVSISGRNSVGFYLNDQTFDEDVSFNATAINVLTQIFDRFGITKYEIDPLGTGKVEIDMSASDTGIKAIQAISDLLSDVTESKHWDIEELYDGTIIAGFDAFRSERNPKGLYVFNGVNDVFAKTINRTIDSAFTHVRCTGTDKNKKDLIPVTRPVVPFRYWQPGEHKTYHAPRVEGVTQAKLEKYCEVLAGQLKESGRIVTYRSNLKPQLVVGDVAEIAAASPEESNTRLGIITEIRHTFGERGYFTEFTASSGGEITTMENKVYTKTKAVNGSNRQTRMSDLIATSVQKEAQPQQSSSTYISYDYAMFDGTGHIELPIVLHEIHQIRVSYQIDTGLDDDTVVFGNSLSDAYAHLQLIPLARKNRTSDGSNVVEWDVTTNRYTKHTFICNRSGNNYYDPLSTGTMVSVSQFTGVDTNAKIWIGACASLANKYIGKIYQFAVVDLTTDETLIALVPREYMVDGAIVGRGLYDIKSGHFYSCSGMTLGND